MYEALRLEDRVGLMLPCNLVVQDRGNGKTEITAIDPVTSMQAIDNPARKHAAEMVRSHLVRIIASL